MQYLCVTNKENMTNLMAREVASKSAQSVRDFMKENNIPVANGQSRNIKLSDRLQKEFDMVKALNIETINRLQRDNPNLYDI